MKPFDFSFLRRRASGACAERGATGPVAILVAAMLLACLATPGRAQNIVLKTGQTIAAQGLKRDGATVLATVQVAGNSGQVGYPVANIARIDFPEPQQRKLAADLLMQGRADEALKQVNSALAFYAPFRDVAGSWWTALSLLQVDALSRLGREGEADTVANELAKIGAATPEVMRTVKIRQAAALAKAGDQRKAVDTLNDLLNDDGIPLQALPPAWLALGSAQLALRNYKPALLAFLHVPVYTPEQAQSMPPALLGSAQAYAALGDPARAITALQKLIKDYPNARETPEAKQRLKRLQSPTAATAK